MEQWWRYVVQRSDLAGIREELPAVSAEASSSDGSVEATEGSTDWHRGK